jgi:hypothetical protein
LYQKKKREVAEMRKRIKKDGQVLLALFLCVSLVLGSLGNWLWTGSKASLASTADEDGPFATMYDSSVLVEEELSKIEAANKREEESLEKSIAEIERSLSAIAMAGMSVEGVLKDMVNTSPKAPMEEALSAGEQKAQLLEKKAQREIYLLEFQEKTRKELQQTRKQLENNLQVDRYIIKYKSPDKATITRHIANRDIVKVEAVDNRLSNEKCELLFLSEKVNPLELAQQLKKAAVEKDIAYIQPDFALNLEETDTAGEPSDNGSTGTASAGESTNSEIAADTTSEATVEEAAESEPSNGETPNNETADSGGGTTGPETDTVGGATATPEENETPAVEDTAPDSQNTGTTQDGGREEITEPAATEPEPPNTANNQKEANEKEITTPS